MASNTLDLEKGLNPFRRPEPPRTANALIAVPSEGLQDTSPADTAPSDGTGSPLSEFRLAVGIHHDPALTETDRRYAVNRGLYQRVVKAEQHASREYRIFAVLINGALGLQIIFASALTALGASGAQAGRAVTAFGAMNTVIAGFLTFLKGSGLPNRLKYYHNEWSKVREYIEQRERDFARGMDDLRLHEEIAVIESMYENVRKDVEANTPDSYISIGTSKYSGSVQPLPSLARHLDKKAHDAEDKVARQIERKARDIERKAQDAEHKMTRQIEKHGEDMEDKLTALAETAAEKVLEYTRRQSRTEQ